MHYLASDRVIHSLDMYTVAKSEFLTAFDELILQPRQLDYRVQFPGPAGTNAVEAALKLARKVTGRTEVITFTGAFHGMTLGALAVTGGRLHRGGAGVPLKHAIQVPFGSPDIEHLLQDSDTRIDEVAAVIVETVQGEGGINVAPLKWLSELAELCQRHGIAAHRRRRADGLRPHRPLLQLRGRRHQAGHRLPVQVNQRLRPAAGAHADPSGLGHLEAG